MQSTNRCAGTIVSASVLVVLLPATGVGDVFSSDLRASERPRLVVHLADYVNLSPADMKATEAAVRHTFTRIGVEVEFLPLDAAKALQSAFPDSEIKSALFVMERLRAIKTPDELKKLKVASDSVLASMQAVLAVKLPGPVQA